LLLMEGERACAISVRGGEPAWRGSEHGFVTVDASTVWKRARFQHRAVIGTGVDAAAKYSI
jgi:hypothetical protein